MSVLNAARVVLSDAPEPLSAEVIYHHMVERGLWSNPHEHPDATVAAAISSDIGRCPGASDFRTASGRTFAIRPRD